MEDKILDQIESLPLNKQADAFYSAYSNVSCSAEHSNL